MKIRNVRGGLSRVLTRTPARTTAAVRLRNMASQPEIGCMCILSAFSPIREESWQGYQKARDYHHWGCTYILLLFTASENVPIKPQQYDHKLPEIIYRQTRHKITIPNSERPDISPNLIESAYTHLMQTVDSAIPPILTPRTEQPQLPPRRPVLEQETHRQSMLPHSQDR